MLRIGIINSNYVSINKRTKKGTEIFDYILIKQLSRLSRRFNLHITAFASGDSKLPVKVESVSYVSSMSDKTVGFEHHKTFELALVSKALSQQDNFDIFHINIGNGDLVLPFAPFIKKPILVTMHGSFLEEKYSKKYLSLFNNLKNFYFVSLSTSQRLPLPNINYINSIPHGINIKGSWHFDENGGEDLMWAGRAIKEKGIDQLLTIVRKSHRSLSLFPILKEESPRWIKDLVTGTKPPVPMFNIINSQSRSELAKEYQKSKIFLFPIQWEEPFGLVLIEAMASGTPVIGYARGSVPEIIKDGITGFIINPSSQEVKGNFIIKKYGIEGFCEAIERIYSMPEDEYKKMRRMCRQHVKNHYTVDKMANRYIETYKAAIKDWKLKKDPD